MVPMNVILSLPVCHTRVEKIRGHQRRVFQLVDGGVELLCTEPLVITQRVPRRRLVFRAHPAKAQSAVQNPVGALVDHHRLDPHHLPDRADLIVRAATNRRTFLLSLEITRAISRTEASAIMHLPINDRFIRHNRHSASLVPLLE